MKTLLSLTFCLCFYSSYYAQCWNSISTTLTTSAVKADGTLWGWGANDYGQIGNGTINLQNYTPIQIGNDSNWESISRGIFIAFAIKTDGSLWGWGFSDYGQLGIPGITTTTYPTQIGTDTNWESVSTGASHTIALKTDGTLWAWGRNNLGQLGDGTFIAKNYPIQVGVSNDWVSISASYERNHALKADGQLWAWGSNYFGCLGNGTGVNSNIPIPIGDSQWQSVNNGIGPRVLGIKLDGTMWEWGYTYDGDAGNGNNNILDVPEQIGNETWQKAVTAAGHNLAIRSDGTLWSWGRADNDQLGTGTAEVFVSIPTQVGNEDNWTNVIAGSLNSMATKDDGSLWVWGYNEYGQLGIITPYATQVLPVSIPCPQSLDRNTFSRSHFSLSPVPATSTLSLNSGIRAKVDEIIIFDSMGKIVGRQTESFENINVQDLDNGVYFLKVVSEDNAVSIKFIKN